MDFVKRSDDVVDALHNAKKDNIRVNLLIGDGCSVTGNIPTTDGFVEKIKNLYPRDYARANPKDYGKILFY